MSVQSEIDRIAGAKSDISTAIMNKGVTVPSGTKLDGMAALIGSIDSSGANLQTKAVTYTANGTNTITPDDGYDGLSSVDVTVDVSGGGGGAKEPYIEETYDANGNLIDVNLVGYTTIRPYAFYYCINLALTSLPSGLTKIGEYAFQNCKSLALTSLPSGITSIGQYAFQNCTSLALTSLPSGLTKIGNNAFQGCTSLALTSLPSGLKIIENYVFQNCKSLALTSLPSGITRIGSNAFQGCTGLTSITFQGKPSTISSSAFNSCTNLKTINVPWASGAVSGAPWGAKNATIKYNYKG